MTAYDIYVLLLCFIVYALLTTLSVVVVITLTRTTLRMIRHGLEDERIQKERQKASKRGKPGCFDSILSTVSGILLVLVFLFSAYVNLQENSSFDHIPTLRVVNSASMAEKNKKNQYLFENGLDDQFETFDMILTYKLPKEEDLALYDVVVYEVDDMLIVHRIVGIEEPNDKHHVRYFLLQGDAIERPDRFPVYYSQMRGIYRGERIPFVGSMVTFMQSPAGWICVILMLFSVISLPIIEKKILKAEDARYALLMQNELAEEALRKEREEAEKQRLSLLGQKAKNKTFRQKLKENDVARLRYRTIKACFEQLEQCRLTESKKADIYKKSGRPIAKVTVVGKTLNVHLALQPEQFERTRYRFADVSSKKGFKSCPMRIRVTSDRQERWVCELISMLGDPSAEQRGDVDES